MLLIESGLERANDNNEASLTLNNKNKEVNNNKGKFT